MAHKPGHIKTGQGGKALGSTTKRGGESPTKPKPTPKPEQNKKKSTLTNQDLLKAAAELAGNLHKQSKGDPSDPNVSSSVRPGGKSGASFGAIDYKNEVNTDPTAPNTK